MSDAGRRLRVAVDGSVLDGAWGGIPKYLTRICAELASAGDEVDILANTKRLWRLPAGAREVGVRVKGRQIWRQAFVPLWLARSGVDVFWAPESELPRWTPIPTVVTIHDLAALRFAGIKPPSHVRRFEGPIARSVRAANRVIAVSRATADDVERFYGIGPERLRVVPNGVDARFSPGNREAAAAAVRERFGVAAPFVLHVGSLEPRKGVDVLLGAATLARSRGARWRLLLAGHSGHRGAELEAAARASGACEVLGPVDEDELLDLLRAAAAFAAPALYEGFGIGALEAMACGTPVVIAAGSGGLEELSGSASIVVGERDPEAWLEALEAAMGRPAALLERGLRRAAEFRWPDVAERTRAVLLEAAAEGRRGARALAIPPERYDRTP